MTQEKPWWDKYVHDGDEREEGDYIDDYVLAKNIEAIIAESHRRARLELAEEIKKMIESSTFHEVCDKNIEDIGNKILDVLKKKLITRIQYGITHLKNESMLPDETRGEEKV